MLVCVDFNFPKILWKSLELTTGVDEVQFTEQLYDYHLTQLNTFPTRGNNVSKLRVHLLELINTSQHGFIPGRSCTTQLVEVLNSIGSLLDSGKQTDIIFMDMSKAFDKVSHAALIAKLERYNTSGSLLDWFSSYLYNRRQRVTTLGATSSKKPVSSGVPQGSILGPILFFLYVNDLPDVVKNSSVACFADDTKIFRRVDSICDADLLQTDLSI
ncbi:Hypothetical predicted protein [Paramuricea clavata]|uniref:Uncharacterized protein n=1 Tax=Paramuricea clavata TaxID=317549 RepID=A0A7D9JBF9_PARCT|nr:Hypothetical predicted protein [Paramuricea clavata]